MQNILLIQNQHFSREKLSVSEPKVTQYEAVLKKLQHKSRQIEIQYPLNHDLANEIKAMQLLISNVLNHAEPAEFYLNKIHISFTEKLLHKHPNLSPTEIKLSQLLKQNYSSKEIANKISITYDSARVARTRLRKKLDIPSKTNLVNYLMCI